MSISVSKLMLYIELLCLGENQFLFGINSVKQRVKASLISSASVSPCPSAVQEQIGVYDFAEMNCIVTSIAYPPNPVFLLPLSP